LGKSGVETNASRNRSLHPAQGVVKTARDVSDAFTRIAHNRQMPSFVYVLGCRAKDRHLTYVGWTTDVARRLAQHNGGKGARTTRGRVWVLLHTERFRTRRQAMSREWYLKRDRSFRRRLALGGIHPG
jgi:putative endonuclease